VPSFPSRDPIASSCRDPPHPFLSFFRLQWTHSSRIQVAALFFRAYTQHRHPIALVLIRQPRGHMQIHRRSSERVTLLTYHIRLGGFQNLICLAKFFRVAIALLRYLPQTRKMAAYMSAINTTGTFRVASRTQTIGINMTVWTAPPMYRTHLDLSHHFPLVEQVC
jgi:hypothetical protein